MASSIPENLIASLEDFKCAIPDCETLELTQMNDVNAELIDDTKLQFALDNAFSFACAYDSMTCCPAGKIAIRRRLKRAMIVIARYELDVLHRRPDVETEYKMILDQLKMFTDPDLCKCSVDPNEAQEVGLTDTGNTIVSCFDERRWDVPNGADDLNKVYFTNHITPNFNGNNGKSGRY